MNYKIIEGNNIDVLKTYPDNYFDSIVTDPPYGISFLGKEWDKDVGTLETYQQCLRVLKPGGHILAFSAARTYHHLAMVIEQAGFEIRDQIMWIYGSGFPKSQDVGKMIQKSLGVKETKKIKQHDIRNNGLLEKKGMVELEQVITTDPIAKQWEGWGTQLKPAHEPICMGRKPLIGSVYKNVQEYGTGAINVDACRVPTTDKFGGGAKASSGVFVQGYEHDGFVEGSPLGRFPANIIMDEQAGEILDEQAPSVGNMFNAKRTKDSNTGTGASLTRDKHEGEDNGIYDGLSGASRFFYCPKVSKKERGPGNNHPTVKPIELMKYLIKLVTPNNGKVLDPFNGSGSTGIAAVSLGHEYVGIELDPKYVEISNKRIEAYNKDTTTFNELFEEQ